MTSTAVLIAPIFAVWTLIASTTEGFIIRHANFVSAGSSIMDATKDSSTCAIVPTGTLETPAPKLIVFDLDNTLWTPELYTLRNIERDGTIPVARKDVNLFPGAQEILQMIHDGKFNATQFAVASRTKSVDWAHDLLHQFNIRNLFQYIEIFPGDKTVHFSNIRAASGISYREMMFFDDARHGKYGNCIPVSEMGVLAVHCPNGLQTIDLFHTALRRYQEWNGSKGTIVEWDGTVSYLQNNKSRAAGVFSNVSSTSKGSQAISQLHTISLPAFSMNMPFAALLANGYKTLETRNGTMFVPYPEGTQMLLHVGKRTYPDGNRHLEIMKSKGLSDDEIMKLKTLPLGHSNGAIVAICELGQTIEMTLDERNERSVQQKVAAYGKDSGKMVTSIKSVQYLKHPIPMGGQGGVFTVDVPSSVLPDGWTLESERKALLNEQRKVNSSTQGSLRPRYSISG